MAHLRLLWLLAPFVVGLTSACGEEGLSNINTNVTETHYQGGGAVDVLFVIDNSGSMGEEQEALAASFDAFLESFLALDTDFHIGVTNMDYEDNAGALLGNPRFLTAETPDLVEAFAANVRLGTGGSGVEKGMESARQALGPAKSANENQGFLREAAVLVVIFVSDEDDQSTADNAEYLRFFLGLKRGDRRRLSISAIAGDVPGGCDTAESGGRYLEMADATGGRFESICQEDLGLPSLGQLVSGYHTAFTLQSSPREGSVALAIGAEVVSPGPNTWTLQGDRIVFAPSGVPPDCSEVQIAYQTGEVVQDVAPVFETTAVVCSTPSSSLIAPIETSGGCKQTPPSAYGLLGLLLASQCGRRTLRRRRKS